MKRLLILLFVLTGLLSFGQAKLTMSSVFSFTPASATSPASTVTYSTAINFRAWVKNTGNANFSGNVTLIVKRDTTGGPVCDSASISSVFALIPNDSISTVLTFVPPAGPAAFKSGGNGNTIVVWPIIVSGTGTLGDSARTVVYVNEPAGIFEFEKTQFKLYPNPVINDLTIKPQSGIAYKKIIIYDVFARKVKEMPYRENIDVSELNSGSYWLIINSDDKSYRINFIKE